MLDLNSPLVEINEHIAVLLRDESALCSPSNKIRERVTFAGIKHSPQDDFDCSMDLFDPRLVGQIPDKPPSDQLIGESQSGSKVMPQVRRIEERPENPSIVLSMEHNSGRDHFEHLSDAKLYEAGHERDREPYS